MLSVRIGNRRERASVDRVAAVDESPNCAPRRRRPAPGSGPRPTAEPGSLLSAILTDQGVDYAGVGKAVAPVIGTIQSVGEGAAAQPREGKAKRGWWVPASFPSPPGRAL